MRFSLLWFRVSRFLFSEFILVLRVGFGLGRLLGLGFSFRNGLNFVMRFSWLWFRVCRRLFGFCLLVLVEELVLGGILEFLVLGYCIRRFNWS